MRLCPFAAYLGTKGIEITLPAAIKNRFFAFRFVSFKCIFDSLLDLLHSYERSVPKKRDDHTLLFFVEFHYYHITPLSFVNIVELHEM